MSLSHQAQKVLDYIPKHSSVGGLTLQRDSGLTAAAFRKALTELVHAGRIAVGRGRGGSVRRIAAKSDEHALLAQLGTDLQSNHQLRKQLGWEESRYWKAHRKLRDAGLIVVGRGRGGSVGRVEAPDPGDIEPSQGTTSVGPPALNAAELKWYPFLTNVLREQWCIEKGFSKYEVQVTAHHGKKDTGGAWSRPDITVVSQQRHKLLPQPVFEVWTFEVKRPGDWSIIGVHEASAHGRRATRPSLLLVSKTASEEELDPGEEKILRDCMQEASRLGVGLIVAYNPHAFDSWDVLLDPEPHKPSPDLLNGFLEGQLLQDVQERLAKWFGAAD